MVYRLKKKMIWFIGLFVLFFSVYSLTFCDSTQMSNSNALLSTPIAAPSSFTWSTTSANNRYINPGYNGIGTTGSISVAQAIGTDDTNYAYYALPKNNFGLGNIYYHIGFHDYPNFHNEVTGSINVTKVSVSWTIWYDKDVGAEVRNISLVIQTNIGVNSTAAVILSEPAHDDDVEKSGITEFTDSQVIDAINSGNYISDIIFRCYSIADNGLFNNDDFFNLDYAKIEYTYEFLPLNAPTDLSASQIGNHLHLTWNSPTHDGGHSVVSYKIYRGLDEFSLSYYATTLDMFYDDYTYTNGQIYYYKVSANNSLEEGPLSSIASITPLGVPTVPQNITILPGLSHINITWESPADNGGTAITNYRIYKGTTSINTVFLVELGNISFYTDNSVTNGITYYYRVQAKSVSGWGDTSDPAIGGIPGGVPTSPTNFTVNSIINGIKLDWTAPNNTNGFPIQNYRIYRNSTTEDFAFLITTSSLSYIDIQYLPTQYYYKISAVNTKGEGINTTVLSGIAKCVPSAPMNYTLITNSSGYYLSWNPPSSNNGSAIVQYNLYYRYSSSNDFILYSIKSSIDSIEKLVDLNYGSTYYFKICAQNDDGEGTFTNTLLVIPKTTPSEPLNLGIQSGDNFLTLTWKKPASDGAATISQYLIYRGSSSQIMYLIATIGNELIYNDTSVINANTYYYRIAAVNSEGAGKNSTVVSGMPMQNEILTVNLVDNGISLSWTKNLNATTYRLYRGISSDFDYTTSQFLIETTNLTYLDDPSTSAMYYYQVVAVNGDVVVGISDIENILYQKTSPIFELPDIPTPYYYVIGVSIAGITLVTITVKIRNKRLYGY